MAQPTLQADYFDGTHSRAHPVTLWLDGHTLHIRGVDFEHCESARQVRWPERTRHGMRIAQLPQGGSLQCQDSQKWDDWRQASGHHESWVVRMQQSWRWVAASAAMIVAVVLAMQQWGVPLAARAALVFVPSDVDEALGHAAKAALDQRWMSPTHLSATQQDDLRRAFANAVDQLAPKDVPPWNLEFRASHLGPNALALPGGTIFLTDELVELVGGDEQVIVGVLAHEMGHLQHRDGVRMVVQVALLGTLSSVLFGDFSAVAAGASTLLGQAQYSREMEHQADEAAVLTLKAAHLSPAVMVNFFERISVWQHQQNPADSQTDRVGIAFTSHPPDAQRIEFFKNAAR